MEALRSDGGVGAAPGSPPRLYCVAELRAYLRGAWRLTRRIEDRATESIGRFEGTLRFEDTAEGLSYREEGELTVAGYSGAAWRCYEFRFPAPGHAEVFFPGGGLFHDLDLSEGAWDVLHPCGDDGYRGRFQALAQDSLQVSWRIEGPRKDLLIETQLARLGDPGAFHKDD